MSPRTSNANDKSRVGIQFKRVFRDGKMLVGGKQISALCIFMWIENL